MSSESHSFSTRTDNRRSEAVFTDRQGVLLAMQDVVGRKWHLVLVSHLLSSGPQGFSDLKDRVDGISSKMLSESLEALEEAGLVSRELLSDRPVRVEYALTERGRALEPVIDEMVHWGAQFDVDQDGGAGRTGGDR